MRDEVSVWSKVWPHLNQTWPGTPYLSCPRTLGLHKLSLALVALTQHSLVSQKKIAFFLPGNPTVFAGENFSLTMLVYGKAGSQR